MQEVERGRGLWFILYAEGEGEEGRYVVVGIICLMPMTDEMDRNVGHRVLVYQDLLSLLSKKKSG
jgi:hypothetical protein